MEVAHLTMVIGGYGYKNINYRAYSVTKLADVSNGLDWKIKI